MTSRLKFMGCTLTGDVQTRVLNNEHAHYLEVFPEHGFFIINAYLKPGPEHSIGLEKAGHLYYVHLKSLLRLRELDCPIVYPIRSYRLRDGSILMVNKEASELLKAPDPTRPCSDDATVIPLRGEEITPTEANPHPDTGTHGAFSLRYDRRDCGSGRGSCRCRRPVALPAAPMAGRKAAGRGAARPVQGSGRTLAIPPQGGMETPTSSVFTTVYYS